MASQGRTVQQVLRAQVDVDAAVEPRDEPVEDPLLQTQTCGQDGDTRLQTAGWLTASMLTGASG